MKKSIKYKRGDARAAVFPAEIGADCGADWLGALFEIQLSGLRRANRQLYFGTVQPAGARGIFDHARSTAGGRTGRGGGFL